MPSFLNTLFRWNSTVETVMNSRDAISALVLPLAARVATCAVRPRPGGFATVTPQEWTATMAVNFLAAVHVTRLALPLLTGQGGGSIITISSVNAALPDPLVIDYSAAKAAR